MRQGKASDPNNCLRLLLMASYAARLVFHIEGPLTVVADPAELTFVDLAHVHLV